MKSLSLPLGGIAALSIVLSSLAAPLAAKEPGNSYTRRDLVSNGAVPAEKTDPDLLNGWGIAPSAAGPWWVDSQGADQSLLYNGDGVKNPLVVDVAGGPTGIVFSGGAQFVVPEAGPARFLFATLSGTIAAWSPVHVPNTEAVAVFTSPDGAVYTGLAIDSTSAGTRLFAADFRNGRVDAFDGTFAPIVSPGAFTDPALPAGYAPYGIQTLAGRVLVAYALRDESGRALAGEGLGVVDAFDFDGNFLARVATGGALNAPWGMALAPANFGRFSRRLLVGNFGDGRINAFDAVTFEPKGHLKGTDGKAIVVDGLWGIGFGNGAGAGPANVLFFAAGPNGEVDGLFGRLDPP